MLFTEDEGIVVPKGTFAAMLANVTAVARYPRENGLYVTEVEVKAADEPESSFPRPGQGR